jgi:hypothetical protein
MSVLVYREKDSKGIETGLVVEFGQRDVDNFVNLTQMAKPYGKKVNHWMENDSTKDYLNALSSEVGIPASQLVVSLKGNSSKFEQGSWAHPLVAIAFAQRLNPKFHVWCNVHIKKLVETGETKLEQKTPRVVTDETVKIHMDGIKYLEDNGDLQLASLLKVHFGNVLLSNHQNLLSSNTLELELEGSIDVAIRLGIQVPKNFESSLGRYVSQRCKHLLQVKNKRYSSSSEKIVTANMYPANNSEVEKAVMEYAAMKALIITLD